MNVNVASVHQPRNAGKARLRVHGQQGVPGGTMLGGLYQAGNAKLRMPRRHASGPLEAVMINIAGGMTGGDTLDWTFQADCRAHLTLTTQACEKVYKTVQGHAEARVALTASAGSHIEWLPQETILFDRSRLKRTIDVDLSRDSSLLLVEPLVFGRQAMGESVESAAIHDHWRIRRDGHLIHAEEFHLAGEVHNQLARKAIAAGNRTMATIVLVAEHAENRLDAVRRLISDNAGVSAWNGKLVARIVATDSHALRRKLIPVINALRDPDHLPKSWHA